MAITEANVTNGTASFSSAPTTASVTPTADRLQLMIVVAHSGITSPPTTPTITGNGLTWVQVGPTISLTEFGQYTYAGVWLFRAMASSPTTGAATISFSGQSQTAIAWAWVEFAGVRTSGSNGADAVRQVSSALDDGYSVSSTPLATQTAPVKSTSGSFAATGSLRSGTPRSATPGTGYTELQDFTEASSNIIGIQTEWRATPSAIGNCTLSGTADWGIFVVELRDANDDPSTDAILPTIAAKSSSKTGTTNAEPTLTYASDLASAVVGDLLIATVAANGEASTAALTAPSGWTLLGTIARVSGTSRETISVYSAIYDGRATDQWTADLNSATGGFALVIYRITQASGVNVTSTTADGSATAPHVVGGCTPTDAPTLELRCVGSAGPATPSYTWETFREESDFGTDPGNAIAIGIASRYQMTAAASGNENVTISQASNTGCVTLAILGTVPRNPARSLVVGQAVQRAASF